MGLIKRVFFNDGVILSFLNGTEGLCVITDRDFVISANFVNGLPLVIPSRRETLPSVPLRRLFITMGY